jgi:GT2 family glycosyltransferase
MRLSIVLVHYRTPDLLARSIAALRRDLALAGVEVPEAEWLVVDNGSDASGRARIEGLGVRRLDPGGNVGYAAAVNLGVARSTGERLLVLNPDVIVRPGCAGALLAALGTDPERTAVAGPRFSWDCAGRLLLPPAERRSRRAEAAAVLARRHPRAARHARAAWRRHARRHWRAREPLASHALSGALLAFHRAVWRRVGPLDEGFRLYFEEVEWLERVRRAGGAGRYVPAAEAVHLYDQSAGAEPAAAGWFDASARRFRRLRYGATFAAALEALDRVLPRGPGPAAGLPELSPRGLDLAALEGAEGPLWIEVSPRPEGFPAAAERWPQGGEGAWRLPDEIARRSGPGPWYLTVADDRGRELARGVLADGA